MQERGHSRPRDSMGEVKGVTIHSARGPFYLRALVVVGRNEVAGK